VNLFDDLITAARQHMMRAEHRVVDLGCGGEPWPSSSRPGLVLEMDTAVELGHPAEGSFSILLWTADESLIQPDRLSLAGPDLPAARGKRLPFVKMVLLLVAGFNEDNCYGRHRELSLLHHRLVLEGFMVRAAALYQQEWSRVSRDALDRGYGFAGLGRSLAQLYKKKPYVRAVEVMVSTSAALGPERFRPIGQQAVARIAAMNRMHEEMEFDCTDCEYSDVCRNVAALRNMYAARTAGPGGSSTVTDS
jgi:CO dehydrogenase/acetyl-CoA synthase beta subunit